MINFQSGLMWLTGIIHEGGTENEEKIRKARMINEKVLQYKQRYTDKDVQDFLAMASLQYVVKLTEEEEKAGNDNLPAALNEMIKKIDSVLQESNSVL